MAIAKWKITDAIAFLLMLRKKYTAEFKTKIVLSIFWGEKEFNVIYIQS